MKQLTPLELKSWITGSKDFFLLDVRETWEHEAYNIGGVHIPMGELMARLSEIPNDRDLVVYCERGIRSVIVIQRMEANGFGNLYNLAGGMRAWQESPL